MNEITLNVEGARVTLPADTLTKLWLERVRADAPPRPRGYPKIGAAFHGVPGIYAGLIAGDDQFDADRHLVVLDGDREDCTWQEAREWAESLGGRLPTRREQAVMFGNTPQLFEKAWYWSGETHASDPDYAWCQSFNFGTQSYGRKGFRCRARAVRTIDF